MTDRTWVILAVRGVGLLFVGMGLPSLLSMMGWALQAMFDGGPGGLQWDYAFYSGGALLGSGAQLGFGVFLLLRPRSIARRWLADVRDRCPQCAYDVKGLSTAACPECGGPLPGKEKSAV